MMLEFSGLTELSGEPKAVLVNYACHGTSLGCRNSKISPEWNGHMLEYIEKEIPGVTGIFIPGAAGDIDPRFVGGLDGYIDNLKKTEALGYEIGEEVVRVFSQINTARSIFTTDKTCTQRYYMSTEICCCNRKFQEYNS